MGKKLWIMAEDDTQFLFHCPGCKCGHGIRSALPKDRSKIPDGFGTAKWTFNNDLEKPTFHPSYLTGTHSGRVDAKGVPIKDFAVRRCHSYIKNGMIHFELDCFHELAGKKNIPLPDIDA